MPEAFFGYRKRVQIIYFCCHQNFILFVGSLLDYNAKPLVGYCYFNYSVKLMLLGSYGTSPNLFYSKNNWRLLDLFIQLSCMWLMAHALTVLAVNHFKMLLSDSMIIASFILLSASIFMFKSLDYLFLTSVLSCTLNQTINQVSFCICFGRPENQDLKVMSEFVTLGSNFYNFVRYDI